jgi:hypothetical protein
LPLHRHYPTYGKGESAFAVGDKKEFNMPNLGFQLEVLKQVLNARAAQGDAVAVSITNSDSLMQFAVLGAMGPDVLRYMPVSTDLAAFLSSLIPSATSGITPTMGQIKADAAAAQASLVALTAASATPAQQALAFEMYFNPLGAAYSVLFSTLVIPLWPLLNQSTDVLNQLSVIVQNHDELGLAGLKGAVEALQSQPSLVSLPDTVGTLLVVIGHRCRGPLDGNEPACPGPGGSHREPPLRISPLASLR